MENGRKSTNQALYLSVLAASAIGAGTYLFDGYADARTFPQEFSYYKEHGRNVYSSKRLGIMSDNHLPFKVSIHGEVEVERIEYEFGGDDSVEFVQGRLELLLGEAYHTIDLAMSSGCAQVYTTLPLRKDSELFSVCLDHLMH